MTATENIDYTSRTITAHGRRNDSVRRWMESDTAKAPDVRADEDFKIRFEDGAMLLSAVASGDLEETKRLLDIAADVNYANIDGLTSLHQACIDENIEMVELLVTRGAMLNACDNEGWTPLHAAASTTALDVITYLVENGANIACVNTEGEVPLDLAEDPDIQMFFSDQVRKQNIDLDEARSSEHRCLYRDALKWQADGVISDSLDIQGATALHVAASKGYIDVVKILLDVGADVNCVDNDYWTPFHAAVYWKQQAVSELLLQKGAKMYARNNIGQTPLDLAEDEMVPFVRSLARNYKTSDGFGGSDNINRSVSIVNNQAIKKSEKKVVGIIKTSKQIPDDKTSVKSITSTVVSKPEIVLQPTHPPTVISKPMKPPGPPSIVLPKKILLLPTSIGKPPTPTIPITNVITSNDQSKQSDKFISKITLPPNTKDIVISKPPTFGISKPPTVIRPPSSTEVLSSPSPTKDVSSIHNIKPGIAKPPIFSIKKPSTLSKQVEPAKDDVNLEKDYNASLQQLAALKNELSSVIKERDALKAKYGKADSDLINYQKILEENARLSRENSSLVKVIATFNRTTPHVDKNSTGSSS